MPAGLQVTAWLLAAFLSLFDSSPDKLPPPARVLVIETGHLMALAQSAERTHMIVFEEVFCLVGIARANGTYHVLAVVRPRQTASVQPFGRRGMISMVLSQPCPPGTIADIHTHPFSSPGPSHIDRDNWTRNRRFTLHLIGFMVAPGKAGFQGHDYTDPAHPIALTDQWLIATPSKEATWKL